MHFLFLFVAEKSIYSLATNDIIKKNVLKPFSSSWIKDNQILVAFHIVSNLGKEITRKNIIWKNVTEKTSMEKCDKKKCNKGKNMIGENMTKNWQMLKSN